MRDVLIGEHSHGQLCRAMLLEQLNLRRARGARDPGSGVATRELALPRVVLALLLTAQPVETTD